jgi:putative peptidoglycan lipid II flippase
VTVRRRGRPDVVLQALVVVSGSSATAILVGILKSMLAAYYFGTSGAMDAYLLALLLPDVAMQLARTGAFNFIPLFAAEHARSEDEAWRAAGKMLTYWLLLLLGSLLIASLISSSAMPLLAPGFGGDRRAYTLHLIRVLLLMAFSLGTARILSVVLHAERRFLSVGLSEVAFQVGSTVFLIAHHGLGIEAIAYGQVFGGFLQLFIVAAALWRRRHCLRAGLDLRSAPVRKLIRLSVPVYIGDSGDKVNLVVTRAFASLLPSGTVSALQYAYAPIEGVHRLMAGSLATALFPLLSRRFAQPDEQGAKLSFGRALVAACVVLLPLTAATWLLADPLVAVLFERGSFDTGSTRLTADALRVFAPALFALGVNELFTSAFHARQNTMMPMLAGFARVAGNALLCAVLSPWLGYLGIALATTLSLYVKLVVLAAWVRGLFTAAELRGHLQALGRVLLAVGTMVVAVYPFAAVASAPAVLSHIAGPGLVGLGLLCSCVYGAPLWAFARPELLTHITLVRRAFPARLRRAPTAPVVTPGELAPLPGELRA